MEIRQEGGMWTAYIAVKAVNSAKDPDGRKIARLLLRYLQLNKVNEGFNGLTEF
jgi:hypothetical protein